MTERQRVFVDMDDVMVKLEEQLEKRLLAADPNIDLSDKSSNYYLDLRLKTPAAASLARTILNQQGFFLSLEPFEGLHEGWQRIEEAGFHPVVLTKPLATNKWCESEKLEWLDAEMGPKVADEAILSPNKADFDGIALIDDRPKIPDADRATWQQTIFSRPYNLNVVTDFRIDNWHDPRLESVLARCAVRYASLFSAPLL